MAKKPSTLKRNRQNERRRLRNSAVKSRVKTVIKKVDGAIREGKREEAASLLPKAISSIDKAASKGVIHKRNASRKVARLSRRVSALKAVPPSQP